jgi:predicted dehydrogenase
MDYGSFKAVCIGSKDTGAPLMNTIQGEQGTIIIDTPVSRMRQYKIKHDVEEVRSFEEEHAMLYEFKQFKNIIENNDVEKANGYLEISTHVLWALEEGRRKAGIIFDADNY